MSTIGFDLMYMLVTSSPETPELKRVDQWPSPKIHTKERNYIPVILSKLEQKSDRNGLGENANMDRSIVCHSLHRQHACTTMLKKCALIFF